MIYLDNAATSWPKAPGVPEAMAAELASPCGNAGRTSLAGLASERIAFDTREALAERFRAPDSSRVCLTKNATEALNIAIFGAVPDGGKVAYGTLDHNSVLRPINALVDGRGVRAFEYRCDAFGNPDRASFAEAIAFAPDLLVITAASNVTGAVFPFEDMIRDCRKAGIRVLLDASQAAGHLEIDFGSLGAACACFPGHKGLLGPAGTGALWLAEGFDPKPLLEGGSGSDSRSPRHPAAMPERYEAGTANTPALAGLLAALRYAEATGSAALGRSCEKARATLADAVAGLDGIRVLGPGASTQARATPALSVIHERLSPSCLALGLARRGVASRHGLHCAPLAHRSFGTYETGGALRLSPGPFTTDEDIKGAAQALADAIREGGD